ncbi:hypothetical protein OO014_10675 [Intrasporangium calvum]|uniref:Uncharacterized protein n=1 Tax=Intrasporangium calvum TaxID=53358 RepID=A0ABT5GIJ7_9MICO|nr:hypothetical protein [Intrasporangium calvum]MDC5697725.1 hypothetical protein [Intrasporangium calvum]
MRKFIDQLISWTGLVLAVVLLVAGGLLTYASSFVNQNVSDQLSQQRITMPAAERLETQEQKDALLQYAGQEMTTGDQAKAFADQYILVHMNAASDNRTYEEVSGEFIKLSKDPNANADEVKALGDLRQTLFMGNTLRGMLLQAYAFGTMAKIASIAAIGAFVAAGVLLVLALLGFRHSKTAKDVLPSGSVREPARV